MGCFLETLKEFKKNTFSINNCFATLQLMQIRLWWGCDFFFRLILEEFHLHRNSTSLSLNESGFNQGVGG